MNRLPLLLCALLACAACALLGAAPAAHAGCGGVEVVQPSKRLGRDAAPLIVGDSVLLGAMPQLAARGFEVNAHGCRQWREGVAVLERRKAQGRLPHLVLMQLGTNASIRVEQVRYAATVLGRRRVLAVLTPREAGGYGGADAAAVRAAGKRWPARVLVLDWVRYAAGKHGWFQPDGIHLMPPGARGMGELAERALRYAAWGTGPGVRARRRRARRRPRARASADPPALTAEALPAGRRGAVGLRIAGAEGTAVTVSEDGAPLATGTLGTRALVLRDVAAWSCTRRTRTFAVSDGAGGTVRVVVRTPSCASQLRLAAPARLRAGAELRVQAGNAWEAGPPLAAEVCLAMPAARERCARHALRAGEAARALTWRALRPGRILLRVRTAGRTVSRTIVVAPPAGRLRVLAAGDSEMQILDGMIRSGLGSRATVHSDARISTGLTNGFFFDWIGHAQRQAASLRPDVTIMFIGANDGWPIGGLSCCSRAWSERFAGKVRSMVRSYARGGAGVVYWFLLPTPRGGDWQRRFAAINAGYRIAAAADPDHLKIVDSVKAFTPNGYRDAMQVNGRWITIHQSDGIHLTPAGMQVASQLVIAAMRRDRLI